MSLLLPSPRSAMRAIIAFALAMFASTTATAAESDDFEVRKGYLSASVRELVDSHDWSLIWSAGEDRMISHPFTIGNNSLHGALESLFSMYTGQFVADLYRGNRVVVVNTPPPRVDVELPGAEGADLAQQSTVVEPSPAQFDLDAESDDQGTDIPLVVAFDISGPDSPDGTTSPLAAVNEEDADESP